MSDTQTLDKVDELEQVFNGPCPGCMRNECDNVAEWVLSWHPCEVRPVLRCAKHYQELLDLAAKNPKAMWWCPDCDQYFKTMAAVMGNVSRL